MVDVNNAKGLELREAVAREAMGVIIRATQSSLDSEVWRTEAIGPDGARLAIYRIPPSRPMLPGGFGGVAQPLWEDIVDALPPWESTWDGMGLLVARMYERKGTNLLDASRRK